MAARGVPEVLAIIYSEETNNSVRAPQSSWERCHRCREWVGRSMAVEEVRLACYVEVVGSQGTLAVGCERMTL